MERSAAEWVKIHLLNPLSKENVEFEKKWARGFPASCPSTWTYIVGRVCSMFKGTPSEEAIRGIAAHLVETGQVILENDMPRLGKVIYEGAVRVSDKAKKAAEAIYHNLSDRRGIRQVLEDLDEDVTEELKNTLAALIDEAFK